METQTQTQTSESAVDVSLIVKMVLGAWETQNSRIDKLLNTLSDEIFAMETAPNRNSGIYLVGHLAAVNDAMLPILGLGERLYPQLTEVFLAKPDKSGLQKPSLDELKLYWKTINETLRSHFSKMQPVDWFVKHTAVSEEDFSKDPLRNKLNIIINRTNHQSYHLGQLIYLQAK